MRYICWNCLGAGVLREPKEGYYGGPDAEPEYEDVPCAVCVRQGFPPVVATPKQGSASTLIIELRREEKPCPTSAPQETSSSLSK